MKTYHVLGLMSGTSLDGLDMAYCRIWKENGLWNFEILQATTITYDKGLKSKLKNAIYLSEEEHQQLHETYGEWLGKQAKAFIAKNDLQLDFVASHGHTSHHRPEDGFTFQLGSGQHLANVSDKKVVCDFRTLDISLGGQGAPLVPIGDELLFYNYDFCLNLGGISNISFKKDGQRIAYDVGLANMPLNYITHKIDLEYDEGGKLAKTGKIDINLLEQLNALEYYKLPYPKSTGYEWFTEKVVPLIDGSKATTEDLLHTFIHHNCEQVAKAVKEHKSKPHSTLFVCGGGTLNHFFVDTLKQKLEGFCEVVIPTQQLIAYKEALVFALMGVLKLEGEINVLSSVTGAKEDSSSGSIFLPNTD